jgi:hypothetical protein
MTDDLTRLVIVPYEKLDDLMHKVEKISEAIIQNKTGKDVLGDYISEKQAKEILSKGTTWFWNKRKSGELTGRKAGNQWYYSKSQIQRFIENGGKGTF